MMEVVLHQASVPLANVGWMTLPRRDVVPQPTLLPRRAGVGGRDVSPQCTRTHLPCHRLPWRAGRNELGRNESSTTGRASAQGVGFPHARVQLLDSCSGCVCAHTVCRGLATRHRPGLSLGRMEGSWARSGAGYGRMHGGTSHLRGRGERCPCREVGVPFPTISIPEAKLGAEASS